MVLRKTLLKKLLKTSTYIIFLSLVLLLLSSCSNTKEIAIKPNPIIIKSQVISYSQLSSEEHISIDTLCRDSCVYYIQNNGQTIAKVENEDRKKSFYIRTVIDYIPLAELTFKYSCNRENNLKTCSKEELNKKVMDTLKEENPYIFYGRYINNWTFLRPNGEKLEGINILYLQRQGTPLRDHLLLGPLTEKPVKFRMEIKNNEKNNTQKNGLESPDLEISISDATNMSDG
jgi:hypothetical protein